MSRLLTILVIAGIGLAAWSFSETTFAQRPPEFTEEGVPYLRVNINPTPIPPVVNINPGGYQPAVQVTRLPEIPIPPDVCDTARNFETGIGRSVAGPISLSFLSLTQPGHVTLVDGSNRSSKIPLDAQLNSIIYLRAGQQLEFDSDAMYSGCRPAS